MNWKFQVGDVIRFPYAGDFVVMEQKGTSSYILREINANFNTEPQRRTYVDEHCTLVSRSEIDPLFDKLIEL